MKTKNNVQKAVLKSLAVGISLVLISFSVSAQSFWKSIIENEIFNEIALAMVENKSKPQAKSIGISEIIELKSFVAYFEIETEKTLELEEWMINETLFDAQQNSFEKNIISKNTFIFREVEDPELKLEYWMFNPKYWGN